jgi:SAM-dependent methyltransferase
MNMRKIFFRLGYDFWRRTLGQYLPDNKTVKVLECGFGEGNLIQLMEEWFPSISLWGLDIDYPAIFQVQQMVQRVVLLQASAESLPFPDDQFNLVISFHVIEHLPHPEKFIAEAHRVLADRGILILATPNPLGIGARIMGAHWSGLVPDHISLKPVDSWRAILNHQGFAILRDGTTGLSGIPIFRKFPLALLNWGPLFLFGFFPWRHGEAYISISQKLA